MLKHGSMHECGRINPLCSNGDAYVFAIILHIFIERKEEIQYLRDAFGVVFSRISNSKLFYFVITISSKSNIERKEEIQVLRDAFGVVFSRISNSKLFYFAITISSKSNIERKEWDVCILFSKQHNNYFTSIVSNESRISCSIFSNINFHIQSINLHVFTVYKKINKSLFVDILRYEYRFIVFMDYV